MNVALPHGISSHPFNNRQHKGATPVDSRFCDSAADYTSAAPSMKGKLPPWKHCPRAPLHSEIPITFSSCRAECINLDPRCTTTAQVSSRHRMSLISQRVLDAPGLISSMPLMLVGLKFASKLQRGAGTARFLLVMSIISANVWHLRWRHQQRLRNGATHPHHGRCVIRTR